MINILMAVLKIGVVLGMTLAAYEWFFGFVLKVTGKLSRIFKK